jgi:glycosyltransferase involved in cell wall biosynthesis
VTGPVSDVVPWLRAARVFVAPLRMGGGVKVKILEALTLGKAVVTTRIGAQGLHRLSPGSLVVADDPDEFADAVARLLVDDPERVRQEARARLAARRLPTWDAAAEQLAACWNEA